LPSLVCSTFSLAYSFIMLNYCSPFLPSSTFSRTYTLKMSNHCSPFPPSSTFSLAYSFIMSNHCSPCALNSTFFAKNSSKVSNSIHLQKIRPNLAKKPPPILQKTDLRTLKNLPGRAGFTFALSRQPLIIMYLMRSARL